MIFVCYDFVAFCVFAVYLVVVDFVRHKVVKVRECAGE